MTSTARTMALGMVVVMMLCGVFMTASMAQELEYTYTDTIDSFGDFESPFLLQETFNSGDNNAPFVGRHPITNIMEPYFYSQGTFSVPSDVSTNSILGGNRDTIVYLAAGGSLGERAGVQISEVGDDEGRLLFSVDAGAKGILELQWDGDNEVNPIDFNPRGLGGIDLVSDTDSIIIEIANTDLPIKMRLEAYSDEGIPRRVFLEISTETTSRTIFSFQEFQGFGGFPDVDPFAVFSNLGAMRLFIEEQDDSFETFDVIIDDIISINRFCLWKSAADATANNVRENFGNFFESNLLLTEDCTNQVSVGDTFTYFLQTLARNTSDISTQFRIKDRLPIGFNVLPGSIEIFLHDGLTLSMADVGIITASGRNIDLMVTISKAVDRARISIFFQVAVTEDAIDPTLCEATLLNRARITTANDFRLQRSLSWDGRNSQNRAVRVCVKDMPILEIQSVPLANLGQLDRGECFTVRVTARNNGNLPAVGTMLRPRVTTGSLALVSDGYFALAENEYVKGLGTIEANSFVVEDIEFCLGPLSVPVRLRIFLENVNNGIDSLPEFCQKSVSSFITFTPKGIPPEEKVPDLAICKRGALHKQIVYQIDLANFGTGAALNTELVETVPEGTVFSRDSDERWICAHDQDPVVCKLIVPRLALGRAECIMFIVDVHHEEPLCEVYFNEVSFDVGNSDEEGSSGSATAETLQYGCPLDEEEEEEEEECCECIPEPEPEPEPECEPVVLPPLYCMPPPTCVDCAQCFPDEYEDCDECDMADDECDEEPEEEECY